ncbi:DUF1707 SHOCT-like domain-containing protein [Actinokineospora iranica]|uniref:DUF1707 domain-containing protein n=1 Tax=Actinokineospora iranica TaxID=1271860 RepID=A0A1G6PL69_9PSEU|nr:DUF1707 domain-containing protein [Actinokineospora iranica]SDC80960.1 protein of unknown function [Actinokineospora iranica]
MTAEQPINPRDLRVSDAEREHVISVLRKATGHGMLTLDEFTVRTDSALAAKTRAELNTVLVDLPAVVNRESGSPAVGQPVELAAVMSSVKREGRWHVPRELLLRNRMSATELDFTEAVIPHREVTIEVDLTGGSVDLLLPDTASCQTAVDVTAGSVNDKVGNAPRGHGPHFVITGTVRAGSLTIRRPTYVRLGALTIRKPWKLSWES